VSFPCMLAPARHWPMPILAEHEQSRQKRRRWGLLCFLIAGVLSLAVLIVAARDFRYYTDSGSGQWILEASSSPAWRAPGFHVDQFSGAGSAWERWAFALGGRELSMSRGRQIRQLGPPLPIPPLLPATRPK
jgi:hypothetical protein